MTTVDVTTDFAHMIPAGTRSLYESRTAEETLQTIGSINLYSTLSDVVSRETQALAGLFATYSAVAVGHAHERATFAEALPSRTVAQELVDDSNG